MLWLKLEVKGVIFLSKHVQNVRFQLLKCKYFLGFWLFHDGKLKNLWVVDKTRHLRTSAWSFRNTYAPWRNGFPRLARKNLTGEQKNLDLLADELEHRQWPKMVQIPATTFCNLARTGGHYSRRLTSTFFWNKMLNNHTNHTLLAVNCIYKHLVALKKPLQETKPWVTFFWLVLDSLAFTTFNQNHISFFLCFNQVFEKLSTLPCS